MVLSDDYDHNDAPDRHRCYEDKADYCENDDDSINNKR